MCIGQVSDDIRTKHVLNLITDGSFRVVRILVEPQGLNSNVEGSFSTSNSSTVKSIGNGDRSTILTKQLDMALSNDAIRDWYAQDIMTKLGIDPGGEEKE